MVYNHILVDHSARGNKTSSQASFLWINKQVSQEISDVFQRRGVFTHRITDRNAGFVGLSLACPKRHEVDYSHSQHLILEIFPPSPKSVTDMIAIFRHVRQICNTLAFIPRLQQLSIRFLETTSAVRAVSGQPTITIVQKYGLYRDASDVKHCLEYFAKLENVTIASVELPVSLAQNKELQLMCDDLELSITGVDSVPQDGVRDWIDDLELGIENIERESELEKEEDLRNKPETGQKVYCDESQT